MRIAVATRNNQIAPLFPGVELIIYEFENGSVEKVKGICTSGWSPVSWGASLLREDAAILICSGLNHFLWGAIQGYGISVIPDARGTLQETLNLWINGNLRAPEVWPPVCRRHGPRRARRRGGRNGRF